MIDIVYYNPMKATRKSKKNNKALNEGSLELIDLVADILAEEFVKMIQKEKEHSNESSNIR